MEFKREQQKFLCTGLDLIHPVDFLPPGKFPSLWNVRSYQEGTITDRAGLTKINSSPIADIEIHTISRLNDYVTGNYIRFLGAAGTLYGGTTSFSSLQTGFASGYPFSIVPYRPEQAASVYAYVASATQMKKVSTAGTVSNVGIFPPIIIPSVEVNSPFYNINTTFNSATSWTPQGVAGTITLGNRLTSVTIGRIAYASGTTGWAAVNPTGGNYQDILAGMWLTIGGSSEVAVVEETFKLTDSGSNTIAAITYDSGSTGLCTIQPTQSITGLARNALLLLGGSESIRVISVTEGTNQVSSFRCRTAGTFSATNAILSPTEGSFWVYLNNTHSAGNTLTATYLTSTMTTAAVAAEGSINFNLGASGYNLANVNGRTLSEDDYIHLSVSIDDPSKLSEGTLVLDVDTETTATYHTADGNSNAIWKTFRSNDFQDIINSTTTSGEARATAISTQLQDQTPVNAYTPPPSYTDPYTGETVYYAEPVVDYTTIPPDTTTVSPADQTFLGDENWTEFRWKCSELLKLGGSRISDLTNVRAIQVRFKVSGTCTIKTGGLWVGGTYGPDTNLNLTPYIYRYRYRSSVTGAKSLPGPATRSGVQALRQSILITPTVSTDPQVDKIDIERLGGNNLSWNYIGSLNNSGTFLDTQGDADVIINPALETDTYQPFPLPDLAKSSTVSVSGTAVTRTAGDVFHTSWARGTEVIINGIRTSLYASPTSTTLFHVTDSIGSGSVNLEIPEPILQGQPLPMTWGPFKETIFGCGNIRASGSVYYCKPGDPDSSPLANVIEVTTPTEIMMNGCLYDSRCFAFSDRKMFYVIPNQDGTFTFQEVANGKGLVSVWALTTGPKIWFMSSDGIYESDGGTPVCITDEIASLFPVGDRAGYAVNEYYPVDFTAGAANSAAHLRLSYHAGFVFFDYLDTNGSGKTLVYDTNAKGWFSDQYFTNTPGTQQRINTHYSEQGFEGADNAIRLLSADNNGYLYYSAGTSDAGVSIYHNVLTAALDVGDSRAKKVYGDITIDSLTNSNNVTAVVWYNNYQTSVAGATLNNALRSISNPIDLSSGSGTYARNLGMQFTWTTSTPITLYAWQPSYLSRPEDTFLRATDWQDGGYHGSKLVRGFLVEADTENVAKLVALQGDQATLQTYAMTHNGQQLKAYAVNPPVVASLLRLQPTQSVTWREFNVSYIYDEYPENATIVTPYTNEGTKGAKFVQGVLVTALGSATGTVTYDGGTVHGQTLNLAHTNTYLSTIPYSFSSPFIAHEMSLTPSANIRIDGVKWIWEPAPELVTYWKTQGTTHDIPGWQFLKDGYIAHISTANLTLEIKVDGTTFTYTIPHSSGQYVKSYLIFTINPTTNQTLKGKLFEYYIYSGSPFRLFKKDCEVRVHPWSGGGYKVAHPFGGDSRTSGAEI